MKYSKIEGKMPQYIRNTACDVDFISSAGVQEYIEDELTKLSPALVQTEGAKVLFECLRKKNTLIEIKQTTKDINWSLQPFEIQSIAVGLKLYRTETKDF
jgi:hypothetical protein